MGLNHPTDLDAWRAWQRSKQHLSRRIRTALTRKQPTMATLWSITGAMPTVVSAVDALTPTATASLIRPLLRASGLTGVRGLIAPSTLDLSIHGLTRVSSGPGDETFDQLPTHAVVLTLGPFLPIGVLAARWADKSKGRHVTVQHGLLTPHAPPLASGSRLLAWSRTDGEFWRSGRTDVHVDVVGSPLLWSAAQQPPVDVDPSASMLYLGQLHGAELARGDMARSAEAFCIAHAAAYRPHPAETDRLSRAFHRHLETKGVTIDRSGSPLVELRRPVISAFSTGVLEAAARGIPACVHFDDPPSWLTEFWERYGMRRWGEEPTPPLPAPAVDPSVAIARVIREMIDE